MLRPIVSGIVLGLAAFWIGNQPAIRPHVDDGMLRIARGLDRMSLALEGNTELRRLAAARIEPMAEFPDGTALRHIGRSVGLLWIDETDKSGKVRTFRCTATLVAPTVLITNHHCLKAEAAGNKLTFELWIDYRGGTPVRHGVDPVPIEVDATLDFALLRLMPPAKGSRPEPLARPIFRVPVPGERLFLVHHADGKPLQVTRTRCRVDVTVSDRELDHTCATLPGSSGALVFAEHDHAIVGLHRSRRNAGEQILGIATPAAALLAKSTTLRDLAPGGLVQAAAR